MKSLLNMLYRYFLLLGVFSILVVSCKLGTQEKDFLKRNVQDTNERNIVKSLTNQERVALSEFQLQDVSKIRSNSKLLAINDWRKKQILLIDKKTLKKVERIEFKTGRGPGELIHFTGFSITEDYLYVIDEVNSKLLKLNFEGSLMDEFSIKIKPHRITSLNSGRLVLFFHHLLITC
ncbi:MAG: 6-bladed beta-propeller [Balneolaceae bacterium]|nr:6-bladed beta-propeller [Balneolaceae bacterium]